MPHALIGTAGWGLPRAEQSHFPPGGSHLERYAARFGAVEINSSFHRAHRAAIWARWRDAVPPDFQFSVKLPKTVTHTARLVGADDLIASFLNDASILGAKFRCLLVQLPPSLTFDSVVAGTFFEKLRAQTAVEVACEPRHESWFDAEPDRLLRQLRVGRVVADPARVPAAAEPGGWRGLTYFRLHGSPKMYYSAYSGEFIAQMARRITQETNGTVWCVFDNTTLGAATRNALDLCSALERPSSSAT